jgi:hypothetical protein
MAIHFLGRRLTFCLTLLLMNIGLLCSSLIDILLDVINKSYSSSLLVRLATYYLKGLLQVVHKIWIKHPYHYDINFVFLHIISWCSTSHSNNVVYIYPFHLFVIHCWIQIQVLKSSSMHFHNSKPNLVMKCILHPLCLFLITYSL